MIVHVRNSTRAVTVVTSDDSQTEGMMIMEWLQALAGASGWLAGAWRKLSRQVELYQTNDYRQAELHMAADAMLARDSRPMPSDPILYGIEWERRHPSQAR